MRAVYDWMMSLADRRWAEPALAGISFAEASFFPLPPDPLLLAMGAARPSRALRYALVTTVFSVLGALLGWTIGALLFDTIGQGIVNFYGLDEQWEEIGARYREHGEAVLFTAALTPIPFKVFTIAGGAFEQSLPGFLAASFVGRGLRFGAEGIVLRYAGEPVRIWVEKWFDWVAIGFALMLIGGFVLLGIY